jgi:hypothetical protein
MLPDLLAARAEDDDVGALEMLQRFGLEVVVIGAVLEVSELRRLAVGQEVSGGWLRETMQRADAAIDGAVGETHHARHQQEHREIALRTPAHRQNLK